MLVTFGQFFVVALLSTAATAQKVPQDPVFDCRNPNFQVIYTACAAGDYSKCCAVGTDCCAGGCCDLVSFCVGVGTSKETCCDVSDPTLCGTGPSLPQPSVICTGSNGLSSYKCPPGSTCNIHNDSCYLPNVVSSSSARPRPTSSTQDVDTETTSQDADSETSTTSVKTTKPKPTTTKIGETTTTDDDATTPASNPTTSAAVSVLTVSVTPTTTSTKSMAGLDSSNPLLLGAALFGTLFVFALL